MIPDILKLLETSFARHWIIAKEVPEDKGIIIITLNKEYISRFLSFIKEEKRLLFTQLTDIYAIDFPKANNRFTLNYDLLSQSLNLRLRVKVSLCPHEDISSVSEVFPCASWYEREVWDMFGILFTHNDNLCRIINERDFAWFPLRKDFPVSGMTELRYNPENGKFFHLSKQEGNGND